MRPKERIPIFLEKVNWQTLAERWGVEPETFNTLLTKNNRVRSSILKYWKKHYDLRFGQMLINLGLMPDKLKIWNDEESEILDDQNISRREFMLWGRCYDADRNPLLEVEWILVKDMTTFHIQAILNDIKKDKYNLPQYWKDIFAEEIKLRNQ